MEMETLNTLLLLHERYGKETDVYWRDFQKQWQYIQRYQVDQEFHGDYELIKPDGTPTMTALVVWRKSLCLAMTQLCWRNGSRYPDNPFSGCWRNGQSTIYFSHIPWPNTSYLGSGPSGESCRMTSTMADKWPRCSLFKTSTPSN